MTPTPSVPMFDYNIMAFIQDFFHNPITDSIFPVITYLGENGFIWIILGLIFLINKKTRKCGIICLCAMAGCFLFGEVFLKNIVCRVRPCNEFPNVAMLIARPDSFSFPSGHSSSSFAAATAIFAFNKKWGIAAIVLAILIAFSRMFLFVHYPTDIIAGMLLGILFALLTIFIFNVVEKRTSHAKRFRK